MFWELSHTAGNTRLPCGLTQNVIQNVLSPRNQPKVTFISLSWWYFMDGRPTNLS